MRTLYYILMTACAAYLVAFPLSCGVTVRPLCRHIVLAQAAAFSDAGYEVETWLIKNQTPVNGYAFHTAVRVRQSGGEWLWVDQPPIEFTATTKQPKGVLLKKEN